MPIVVHKKRWTLTAHGYTNAIAINIRDCLWYFLRDYDYLQCMTMRFLYTYTYVSQSIRKYNQDNELKTKSKTSNNSKIIKNNINNESVQCKHDQMSHLCAFNQLNGQCNQSNKLKKKNSNTYKQMIQRKSINVICFVNL